VADEHLKLDIDKDRLDQEWSNQPLLYWKWAKKAADAQMAYDEAKSELSVERAELDLDIRSYPGKHGLADVKITESVITSTIDNNQVVKSLTKRVRQAKHDLDISKAAVEALEHKKKALSYLVELWIRDYYSEPHARASSDEGNEWTKRQVRRSGMRNRTVEDEVQNGVNDD